MRQAVMWLLLLVVLAMGTAQVPARFLIGDLPETELHLVISIHVEPHPRYLDDPVFYRRHAQTLRDLAVLLDRWDLKLSVQVQTPFLEAVRLLGDDLLLELVRAGHEVGVHFHEHFHVPRDLADDPQVWTRALGAQVNLVRELAGVAPVTWSGANLYPMAFEVAPELGLTVHCEYKNPVTQAVPPGFRTVHPWRPLGSGSLEERLTPSVDGPVLYLPAGVWPASLPRPSFTSGYFRCLDLALQASLAASRPDRINVMAVVIHPEEFSRPREQMRELEAWIRGRLAPLLQKETVVGSTYREVAELFLQWEQTHSSGR